MINKTKIYLECTNEIKFLKNHSSDALYVNAICVSQNSQSSVIYINARIRNVLTSNNLLVTVEVYINIFINFISMSKCVFELPRIEVNITKLDPYYVNQHVQSN